MPVTGLTTGATAMVRLEAMAIAKRYPMTAQKRSDIIEKMHGLLLNGEPHLQAIAARCLLTAEAQNQADDHLVARLEVEVAQVKHPPQVNVTVVNVPPARQAELDEFRKLVGQNTQITKKE